jgi:hypothetical protein
MLNGDSVADAYLFELLRFYREEYQTPAVDPSNGRAVLSAATLVPNEGIS